MRRKRVVGIDVEQFGARHEGVVDARADVVAARHEPQVDVLQHDGIELRHDFRGQVVALHHDFAGAARALGTISGRLGDGGLDVSSILSGPKARQSPIVRSSAIRPRPCSKA